MIERISEGQTREGTLGRCPKPRQRDKSLWNPTICPTPMHGILKGEALKQVSKGQRPLALGGPPEGTLGRRPKPRQRDKSLWNPTICPKQMHGILKGEALKQVSKGQRPLETGGPPEARWGAAPNPAKGTSPFGIPPFVQHQCTGFLRAKPLSRFPKGSALWPPEGRRYPFLRTI